MVPSLENEISIFSTVNCPEEGGPGNYNLIVMYEDGDAQHSKEFFCNTTIKRLGIMSLIVALEAVAGSWVIMMYIDSQYIVDAMTKGWAHRWKSSGWKKSRPEDAENRDLWEELLTVCETQKVEFFEIDNLPDEQYSLISGELADEIAMQESLPVEQSADEIVMQESLPVEQSADETVMQESLPVEQSADEIAMQESLPVEQYADEIAMQEDLPLAIRCEQL